MNEQEILDLFQECNFHHLSEDNYYDNVLNCLSEDFIFDVFTGASKLVIAPADVDYVIKLPFKGVFDYDGDTKSFQFYKFSLLYLPHKHEYDYCAEEMRLRHMARQERVSSIFLKNKYIGTVNNEPIYLQKKVRTFHQYYNTTFGKRKNDVIDLKANNKKMKDSYEKCKFKYPSRNKNFDAWLTDVYNYYGEKTFSRLIEFMSQYISDLHLDNIGYEGSRPIILDYGSYYGVCSKGREEDELETWTSSMSA